MNYYWIFLWILFSLSYYLLAQTCLVSRRHQKFYIHPVIGLHKTFMLDLSLMMSKWQIVATSILYSILYLPITIPYFIVWLIYSICKQKFIFFSDKDSNNEI